MKLAIDAVLGLAGAIGAPIAKVVIGPVVGSIIKEIPTGLEVDDEPVVATKRETVRAAPPLKGTRTFLVGLIVAVAPAAVTYAADFDWSAYVSVPTATMISGGLMIAMRLLTAFSGAR